MATKHAARRPSPKKIEAVTKRRSAAAPGHLKAQQDLFRSEPKRAAARTQSAPAVEATAAAEKPIPVPHKAERRRVSADEMGKLQREISVSEFFTKNRHLLGFDNASRALLTSVKEAVDNSLDACEEGAILPDIVIRITEVAENRFRMAVEDNGPGIVKAQVPHVFGRLLYGSKFHRLRQSRGQQGIGISAAGMYGQLTTGKPIVVTSKTGKGKPAQHLHVIIDTAANKPVVVHEDTFEWEHKDHGTVVEIEMEAVYKGGRRSVDEYIQQVAVANPHARIEYWAPGKKPIVYPRITPELPPETREIKPHPYGVELGVLMRMMRASKARTLASFLSSEFSRVSAAVAEGICRAAGVSPNAGLKRVSQEETERIYKAISTTKIMAPPTNCLAPIGEAAMLDGLKAMLVQAHVAAEEAARKKAAEEALPAGAEAADRQAQDAAAVQAAESMVAEALAQVTAVAISDEEEDDEDTDAPAEPTDPSAPPPAPGSIPNPGVIDIFGKPCFVTAVSRAPRVYRGNPFQVEAAIAYGGEMAADELATVYRFANRVPLLYQQGACAMTQAVLRTNWRGYGVDQARGALPTGPILVLLHMASVWVPFTSEAKEAVAHYDEVIGELKFALQECGRRLSRHIRRRQRQAEADKKQRYIEKYIPHIGDALRDILGLGEKRREEVIDQLTGILERSRKM